MMCCETCCTARQRTPNTKCKKNRLTFALENIINIPILLSTKTSPEIWFSEGTKNTIETLKCYHCNETSSIDSNESITYKLLPNQKIILFNFIHERVIYEPEYKTWLVGTSDDTGQSPQNYNELLEFGLNVTIEQKSFQLKSFSIHIGTSSRGGH